MKVRTDIWIRCHQTPITKPNIMKRNNNKESIINNINKKEHHKVNNKNYKLLPKHLQYLRLINILSMAPKVIFRMQNSFQRNVHKTIVKLKMKKEKLINDSWYHWLWFFRQLQLLLVCFLSLSLFFFLVFLSLPLLAFWLHFFPIYLCHHSFSFSFFFSFFSLSFFHRNGSACLIFCCFSSIVRKQQNLQFLCPPPSSGHKGALFLLVFVFHFLSLFSILFIVFDEEKVTLFELLMSSSFLLPLSLSLSLWLFLYTL